MKPKKTLRERTSGRLAPITPNQILAVLKEMVNGTVNVAQVARALTEASYFNVSTGKKVYIIAGPGSGYRGTLKEINGAYATVVGNMGKFWFPPVVLLMPDENAPSNNASS
jgi:hypothetical protein